MRGERNKKENRTGSAERVSVRCGIYTRKSTEKGLDQAFNTLDAQREAAELFINSQRQEGWAALLQTHDNGGAPRCPASQFRIGPLDEMTIHLGQPTLTSESLGVLA